MSKINLLDTLTPQERDVYDLIFAGLERKQIGDELGLTLSGVKYHLNHIYAKLNVRTRNEAVVYGMSVGAVVKELQPEQAGADGVWCEADIRTAAAELVWAGVADRKVVNAIVTDLLVALKKKA